MRPTMLLRWGVAGAGKITSDFAKALLCDSERGSDANRLQAVAASERSRAELFRDSFSREARAYGSYEELAHDGEVDIVYIGLTNQKHYHVANLCLDRGKHVLLEKPATLSEADTRELISKARSRNLFFMEGIWTLFFPALSYVLSLDLGRLTYFSGCFSAPGNWLNEEATDHDLSALRRFWDPELGGSILYDMGIYPIAISMHLLGRSPPSHMRALAVKGAKSQDGGFQVGSDVQGGVDVQGALSAIFPDNHAFASIRWSARGGEPGLGSYIIEGTKGRAIVHPPAHAPTKVTVEYFDQSENVFFEESVPPVPAGFDETFYPNSTGFVYEINAVNDAIAHGKQECDEYTHEDMINLAHTLQSVREQIDVRF